MIQITIMLIYHFQMSKYQIIFKLHHSTQQFKIHLISYLLSIIP